MAHVFVSYVREDHLIVDRLCEKLKAQGVEIWLDRKSVHPGERWKEVTREAIRSGDYFIACFSKNFQARVKTYMHEELTLAVEELHQHTSSRAWFIPVLLDECNVPAVSIGDGATLIDLQFISLFADEQKAIRRICDVINPIDPWQKIYLAHSLRGSRMPCVTCRNTYNLDNLHFCSPCGGAYCYQCVWKLRTELDDSHSSIISRCNCGGEVRL